jgi:DNA-directed RNA polymerase specialized sigma subunit
MKMHTRMVHLHKRDKTKKERNKEGTIMNEPIERVVNAMQQLPDHAQQIMANRFVWEIKEVRDPMPKGQGLVVILRGC